MKNKSIIKIFLPMALLFGIILSSCTIDDSINNSPNAINEANVKTVKGIQGVSIGLQVAVGDWYSGDRSRISSIWTWQMCAPDGLGRSQPVAWNSYNMEVDGPTNDMWTIAYRGVRLANDIIEFAPQVDFIENSPAVQNYYVGMAKAYKAMIFGEMAGFYGSIPIAFNKLDAPQLVAQNVAYDEAQKLLDEAIALFGNAMPVDRDLNFGTDDSATATGKWIAVCNSLKARFYLHVKDTVQALVYAKKGISGAANNLMAYYSDEAAEHSPWGHWSLTEVGEPIRGEASFVRKLQAEVGDTRLGDYFTPEDGPNFWGFAQQVQAVDTNELNTEKIVRMKKYRAYATNFPLITYQENVLIRAEAAARGGDAAGATTDLNAIRNAAGLGNYTGGNLINEIMLQKYLQLFLEGQSYHDMRRTGTLPDPLVPKRWIYPLSEKNANPNVPTDNDGLVKWTLP